MNFEKIKSKQDLTIFFEERGFNLQGKSSYKIDLNHNLKVKIIEQLTPTNIIEEYNLFKNNTTKNKAQTTVYQLLIDKDYSKFIFQRESGKPVKFSYDKRKHYDANTKREFLKRINNLKFEPAENHIGFNEIFDYRLSITEKSAIKFLAECMETIQREMTDLSEKDCSKLEELTGFLWARKIDQNHYADPEESKKLEYDVKRAASYIIVNQFIFYHLLQYHQPDKFKKPLIPNPDSKDPASFNDYFNEVKKAAGEGDYLVVFNADLLSILPKTKNVVDSINKTIEMILDSGIEQVNQDILGKIFHNMIPKEIRRRIAAYYTSNSAAQLLAMIAINKPEAIVIDLTCGSGTLLVEAYHVKDELYKKAHPEMPPEKRHNEILKSLYGNDISVFAAHLASINLARQNLAVSADIINITIGDGLSIRPSDKIAPFKSSHEGDLWIEYPYADCILINPPFSRQVNMSKETLNHINSKMKEYGVLDYVDGRMGLNAYFVLHTDQFLKEDGIMALVISSATFTTNYATKLLEFLMERKYTIPYVFETLASKPVFSEDCDFKEYMVVFKKTKEGTTEKDKSELVSFASGFTVEDVPHIYKAIVNKDPHPLIAKIKTTDTMDLFNSNNWNELFIDTHPNIDKVLQADALQEIGKNDQNIKIMSGYHGTYSAYLMLPNDSWNINAIDENYFELEPKANHDKNKIKIPSKYLVKAIRKPDQANAYKVDPDHFVLNLPYVLDDPELTDFKKDYLNWAKEQFEIKWNKGKKDGHKRIPLIEKPVFKLNQKSRAKKIVEIPWYSHAHHTRCYKRVGSLFSIVSKCRPKTRVSLGIYTNEIAAASHTFAVIQTPNDQLYASWMASTMYLISHFKNQQTISTGLYSMQIKDFARVIFPKYEAISETAREECIDKWNLLSDKADNIEKSNTFLPNQFFDGTNDKIEVWEERKQLDTAWLKALNFPEVDISNILTDIYEWIVDFFKVRH